VVGIYADEENIQRLGECIGKGAFGAVYKAFNWGTGEAVAVKQIKTADLPKSELRMIEVGSMKRCRQPRLMLTYMVA
jgi:serine/threonine protein kinase